MNVCSYCDKPLGYLPYVCRYCGESFCVKHRLPERHSCEGLEKWKRGELKKFKKPIRTIETTKPFLEPHDVIIKPRRRVKINVTWVILIILIVFGICYLYSTGIISRFIEKSYEIKELIPTTTRIITTTTVSKPPELNIYQMQIGIHELINQKREESNLKNLSWNYELAKIAREHSEDMAKNHYFSHEDLEGRDFTYRYEKAGFNCKIVYEARETKSGAVFISYATGAENIFQNNRYNSVTYINGIPFYDWNTQEEIIESTVEGWMNSQGHRENILTPYWKSEGIGIAISDDDKIYITQNFC